ncbi:MAG: hypothetical protein WA673_07475, partial [Candidatus Acidiferrales bacterium]
ALRQTSQFLSRRRNEQALAHLAGVWYRFSLSAVRPSSRQHHAVLCHRASGFRKSSCIPATHGGPAVAGTILRVTVQPPIADKLRDLAQREKRPVGLQLELILEKYFDEAEKNVPR